jgi:DNA invertase Pin-like site-specific DNA recombinase
VFINHIKLRKICLNSKLKINLASIKENLDISTPTGKLILIIIDTINEFEKANLLECQREDIVIVNRRRKFKGKKVIEHPKNESEIYLR